jgi:hypothetical protein
MDHLQTRLDALEHHVQTLQQQTHTVTRQLRWWRGLAGGLVVLAVLTWALPLGTAQEDPMAASDKDQKGLAQRVAALETLLKHFSREKNEVFITGANLHLVNGIGSTNCFDEEQQEPIPDCPNGLGNLIVGYNESRVPIIGGEDIRTGSHNVVVGQGHNFSAFGGLVVGDLNEISSEFAVVSGGSGNTASGAISVISGGQGNLTTGTWTSISGGQRHFAGGTGNSISGGESNSANGFWTSISGGFLNFTDGTWSSVSGGIQNGASGEGAVVSGGGANTASGGSAVVSGGFENMASGEFSAVSGGGLNPNTGVGGNTASGIGASVSGGSGNTASGNLAVVSGGHNRTAAGEFDWVAGSLVEDE